MFLQVAWVPWSVVTFIIPRSANVVRPGSSITVHWAESWRDPLPPGPGPPHPVPALTPGLAQISRDPPPPPPYLSLSRHWRHSIVQNTAQFLGINNKDKTTGLFTKKIFQKYWFIAAQFKSKGSSKIFDNLSLKCFIVSFLGLQRQIAN